MKTPHEAWIRIPPCTQKKKKNTKKKTISFIMFLRASAFMDSDQINYTFCHILITFSNPPIRKGLKLNTFNKLKSSQNFVHVCFYFKQTNVIGNCLIRNNFITICYILSALSTPLLPCIIKGPLVKLKRT